MKKCNFFSVLLVALFMLVGFASNAQTYKALPEAITVVSASTQQAQAAMSSSATVSRMTNQSALSSATNGMKVRIGRALLDQFKNNVDVATALNNVNSQFTVSSQRAQVKSEVLNFYKNLLLI